MQSLEGPAARKTSPWPLGSLKGFILSGGSPALDTPSLATPLWPAGPAGFLSSLLQVRTQLCGHFLGGERGRVLELHLKSLPGGMDLKNLVDTQAE